MVKFNSRSTYEQQRAYLRFQLFKRQRVYLMPLITSIIFLGLAIFFFLRKDLILAAVAIVPLIVTLLSFFSRIKKIYKVNLHNKDFSNNPDLIVEMKEDGFFFQDTATQEKVSLTLDNILLIADLKKYIFLYINENQAICLSKDDIVEGSFLDFLEMLPQEYKKSNYRKFYK